MQIVEKDCIIINLSIPLSFTFVSYSLLALLIVFVIKGYLYFVAVLFKHEKKRLSMHIFHHFHSMNTSSEKKKKNGLINDQELAAQRYLLYITDQQLKNTSQVSKRGVLIVLGFETLTITTIIIKAKMLPYLQCLVWSHFYSPLCGKAPNDMY